MLDGPEDLDAVAVVETKVRKDEIERALPHEALGVAELRGGRHVVAVELKDGFDRDDDALLVVDDEDLRRLAHRSAPRAAT